MNLEELRAKHSTFIYDSYSYHVQKGFLNIVFHYHIPPDLSFNPQISIPLPSGLEDVSQYDNLIFHLGIIESFSYWKATCSPVINIQAGTLSDKQLSWWQQLLLKGMGEYFYINQINFTKADFITLQSRSDGSYSLKPITPPNQSDSSLVLVGGGKDSIVTIDSLRDKLPITLFSLNPTEAIKNIVSTAAVPCIYAHRTLDPLLLKLNQSGYLNGHTPFSAYLAFLSLLIAHLYGHQHIIVSNERSSNEESLTFLNTKINHQYSKSFNFEQSFHSYSQTYLSSTNYFSLLRPLYEIQIAKLFSHLSSYFQIFTSCNVGQKTSSWCGKCPKCLFVFTSLFPFIPTQKIIKIFNKNLFEDESLLPIAKQLIGHTPQKPLECVGTREESLIAFYLSIQKYQGSKLPPLLDRLNSAINFSDDLKNQASQLLNSWGKEHLLTDQFEPIIREYANL